MFFENLKLSKIFISLKKLNEVSFKLSYLNYNETLKNDNENPKKRSNLWNLGIIIYYLLFKEYPYEGENKKESNIEFQLKKITNKDLKDLLNKIIYLNEEISWENYFNHSFFIPKIEHNSFFIPKIGYLSDEHKLEFDFSSHKYQLLENYENYDMNFKISLIGDSGVGKSYLYSRKFGELPPSTIGFDYFTFEIKIDDKIIKLQIWDTAGQEMFRKILSSNYRNSSLAIFVYSINNRKSFEHINDWLKEAKECNPNLKIFLIGNNLENEREVEKEEGMKYKNDNNLDFFMEYTPKNGFDIRNIYIKASYLLYDDFFKTQKKK